MAHVKSLLKASSLLLLVSLSSATNVKDHLVGVQRSSIRLSLPPTVRQVQGSGICINVECSVIVTAYHTQMLAGSGNLHVVNGRTKKVLSLANSSDTNKTDVPAGRDKTLFYNPERDVSFVYTKRPIPHKSGVQYSYRVYAGEKITVAGYCNHKFESKQGVIIGSNVPIVVGLAHLNDDMVLDIQSKPGESGSAVLDERGNLLGMIVLSGVLKMTSGDLPVSVALPLTTIAKALVDLDPPLGSTIFNQIPEQQSKSVQMPVMLNQESDLPEDTSPIIEALSPVPSTMPDSVSRLRARAKAASALMANFVTKQCFVQGTQKAICHEVSVVDGQQLFRKIDKNGTLGRIDKSFPIQKHGVWTQSDWSDTLGEVADNSWVFEGTVGESYLFTFKSVANDDRCYYEEYSTGIPLFGGGHPEWKGSVACFEEIVTDKKFNVRVVFAEMYPSDGCVTQLVQTAIYYDWVELEGLNAPMLLPVRERVIAKVQGQKDLWYANVSWTGYERFRAWHKIRF